MSCPRQGNHAVPPYQSHLPVTIHLTPRTATHTTNVQYISVYRPHDTTVMDNNVLIVTCYISINLTNLHFNHYAIHRVHFIFSVFNSNMSFTVSSINRVWLLGPSSNFTLNNIMTEIQWVYLMDSEMLKEMCNSATVMSCLC